MKDKHGVLVFGRFNPPTTGHAKLIKKVDEVSKRYGASHHIVLSHLHDSQKNPLNTEQKLKYIKKYFPNHNIEVSSLEQPGIIQQAEKLNGQYDHLHVVAGDDRIPDFERLLHKYNGKNYNYKSITLHSSGPRTDKKDVSGMSSSKMRQHAKDGNYKEFRKGIPNHISEKTKHELFDDVKKGVLKEEIMLKFEQFSQGYPVQPDTGPGDNPDPVKEKEVNWGKVKHVGLQKAKKWSGFKSKLYGNNVVGNKVGDNQGSGIGPTYDTRYGQDASATSGIGDPSFRESIDSPYETPYLPAYGVHGSGNADAISTPREKDLQLNSPAKLKNKQKFRDLRKSLGVPIG